MSNGPMGNPMHSPLGGPNRMNMNGMPVNPQQSSPHHHPQMGNMPPNMNAPNQGPPNMMSNSNVNSSSGNNTPSSINSPSTPMSNVTNSGPNMNMNSSNNSIPGSNNNGPNLGPQTNNSNMNQNQMPPHQMGPMGPMYSGPKPMPVSAGKIYPADTPMVFNPQNPNAPPIYPCGVCHKEVHDNDQGLLCESGCNFWFHR